MKDLTSVIAAAVAFAVTAGSGYFVIPYLKKLKFGQTILDIGPKWHKGKQGTPTMGGVMIIAGVLISILIAFGNFFGARNVRHRIYGRLYKGS